MDSNFEDDCWPFMWSLRTNIWLINSNFIFCTLMKKINNFIHLKMLVLKDWFHLFEQFFLQFSHVVQHCFGFFLNNWKIKISKYTDSYVHVNAHTHTHTHESNQIPNHLYRQGLFILVSISGSVPLLFFRQRKNEILWEKSLF